MPKKTLIIITSQFPVQKGEPWLADEVKYIPKEWKTQVFCIANTNQKTNNEYDGLELLPNTFTYKRHWGFFFNRYFVSALFTESYTLIRKGIFWKTIVNSISVLMRAYEMAKWFAKQYIKPGEEYILYSYWGNENATMACLVKTMNTNVKAICRVHGIDVYEEITHLHHIQFRKFQLKHLTRMFSVSQAGSDYIKNKYPFFTDKISTSYLGTEKTGLNPIPGKERLELVSCAMVRNVKQLHLVLEILENMKIPVQWTLAGDGPDFEALKTLAKKVPANITTVMPGYMNKGGIKKLYETVPFHYYISTSFSEGIAVAMMESIGYGVPIISTDVGGCKEVVTKETGRLIPAVFDTREVATLLADLYNNYDYSNQKRKSIHDKWDRKFNAEKNYLSFYEKIN